MRLNGDAAPALVVQGPATLVASSSVPPAGQLNFNCAPFQLLVRKRGGSLVKNLISATLQEGLFIGAKKRTQRKVT